MEMQTSCGGGAIKIYSKRNLTINAAIRANGVSLSPFNQYSIGGSSGGTIILESARHVILGENALLEAKGADAQKANNRIAFQGGGGGGGVIAINFLKGFVGRKPTASENTKGGEGTIPGDNGVIVINGTKLYGFPPSVIEEEEYYHGCVDASKLTDKMLKISMKAHLASPMNCIKQCKDNQTWALIRLQECVCSNMSLKSHVVNNSQCQSRCLQNSSLVCGGEHAYSMYTTGYWPSSTIATSITPLTTAILPSESSLVSTTASEAPTDTEKPTTRSPTEPSDKFEELENVTLTEHNVIEVVEKLQNLTSEEQLNGGDTRVAIKILFQVANDENLFPRDKRTSQALGENILQVASSLLSEENINNWGVPTEEENGTATVTSQAQLLVIVENFGLRIGQQLDENESIVIESKNIAMVVETVAPSDSDNEEAVFPPDNVLGPAWVGNDRVLAHKKLLDELAADNTTRTVVVYAVYNGVSYHFPFNTTMNESSQRMIVNSRIMALKFNKNLTTPFAKPIRMWFDKLQTGENLTAPLCSFLDVTRNEGIWSGRGCHVIEKTTLTVECACDHLTNFAVLMQVKDFEIPPPHFKALTVITYVGCGISLFGLALTLATFLSLETLASERTSIHKNLVVAIGLAQIVFLAGIDATYNPIACKAVALFLHYLYTAAFTWMLCEGIHLYSKVVEVFSEGSKMKYYYALGWGVPLTIVFISAAARWGGYGTERACWISIHQGLIWAFVVPVLIIMTINFVVMIMVIKVVITSVTSLQSPGNTSQVKAGVKGMIVLLPLLGLTWVFGLMAISKDTIVFQYLFAILNSLQGLFIFAFHCIGNSEVRVAYKRLHEKRTLARSLPEHSLSSSHHSKEKKRMDSHETNLTGEDEMVVTKTIRSVSDVKLAGDNMAMQTLGPASPKTSLKTVKTRQDRGKTSETAPDEEVTETIKETTSNIQNSDSSHRKSKILSCPVL